METKKPVRPNFYTATAILSHQLTADVLTPRPPAMSRPVAWYQDIGGIDRLYWGFCLGLLFSFAVAYWWVA